MLPQHPITPRLRLIDKISRSRFFTISLGLHIVLILILGGTVLYKNIQEPTDFVSDVTSFVDSAHIAPKPPQDLTPQPTFVPPIQPTENPIPQITRDSTSPSEFEVPPFFLPSTGHHSNPNIGSLNPSKHHAYDTSMTPAEAQKIAAFANWTPEGTQNFNKGLRQKEFKFVAFLGRYQAGNWNSTVQVRNNQVVSGSLPNLLYYISKVSANKIQTNERDVRVIPLDSDLLFSERPPFIFLTGTRDFVLTEKEVANLRKYVQLGGAIWGDSSVPGQRSRFDIAFKREMKRVIPDVDKDFEPLPPNHPIYSRGYFPEIKDAPAGLNYYKEPVYALKLFGEVSIIYTANDYGDMLQIGLTPSGEIDLGRDGSGNYVATNRSIWENRDVYMNNITDESVKRTYEFSINIVTHLLTRWDDKIRSATSQL